LFLKPNIGIPPNLQIFTGKKGQTYHYLQVETAVKMFIFACMGAPLTKRTTDCSTLETFLVSFFYDSCGKEWKSLPVPFESGSFSAIEHEEARKIIWAQEHRIAFEKANLEAHFHFNQCPDCKNWVCDECFCMDRKENLGPCRNCRPEKK